jgi:hypothetical protein
VILSLNEVAAIARKAARGAGYDWATADEAARATRRLCEARLDGCAVMAGLLDHPQAQAARRARLVIEGGLWHGQGAALCPIRAGAALCDRIGLLALDDAPVTMRDVIAPGVLLAYVAQVAQRLDHPVAMRLGEVTVMVGDGPLDARAARATGPVTVVVSVGDDAHTDPHTDTHITNRAHPNPAAWDRLCQLAHLTYAPATEASRRKGAGGDLPDTD